jgi:hypothetical protein
MAAAAGVGLMEVAGLVLSLIGTGESTASLFTGGSDESDIVDKLETDLASVFNTQLADDEIQKAASVAQTTQTFFAIDYQNTKNQTPADRLALLNNANRGPQLTDLKNKATDMEGWARDNPGAIAQQATSLSLTIYGLIILTYRELAANTPVTPGPGGTKDRDDLLEDMRGYAATGLKQILPLYQSVLAGRLGAVGDPEARHDPDGDRAATPDYPGYTTNWTLRGFTDAWVSFGGNPHGDEDKWVMWTADWRSPEWGLINDAHAAYTRLLRTGTDDDHLALGDILSHPVFTQDNLGAAPTPEQLVQIQKTGAWLASAPRALQALRNISGQLDYVVAYNNGAAHVATVTGDGAKDWNGLGCAPRSAPSIAKRFGSSYLMAFSSRAPPASARGPAPRSR